MKLRPLLVPALLLTGTGGVFAWLMLAEPPQVPGKEPVAPRAIASPKAGNGNVPLATDAPIELSARPEASAAPNPGDIRDVSPEGVTAPSVSGDLKRVAPSERYLELKNPPVEEVPDGPLELIRVQVLDSGHIKSERLTVKLAHIEPLALDETCVSRLGGTWPCGARARTFLRGLIRQLKITCEKIDDIGPWQIKATCQRGRIDLSARLVRYGWADPALDAPEHYRELAQIAKDQRAGKWQSEWLNELPQTDWSLEADTTLPDLEELAPEIVEWSLRSDQDPLSQDGLFGEEETLVPLPEQ